MKWRRSRCIVDETSVLQRLLFRATRKSPGRRAILLHLSELKRKLLSVPAAHGWHESLPPRGISFVRVPIWGYYRNYRLIVNNLNLHSKMLILFFIYYIWYKHKIKEKNISAIRMLSILSIDLGCDIWYFRRRKTI